MNPEKKAVALTTASTKNESHRESYHIHNTPSRSRTGIPKTYQSIYGKAVTGKSRKAAMHAQCLECCGWQIKEVFLCTDVGCPLYPYRPKSRISQVMKTNNTIAKL